MFIQSALQGEPLAIGNIGKMYELGAGIQQSNVMAYAHYKIAKSKKTRFREAIDKKFNSLKSQMTAAQIQAGEQEAKKLMREYGLK